MLVLPGETHHVRLADAVASWSQRIWLTAHDLRRFPMSLSHCCNDYSKVLIPPTIASNKTALSLLVFL